MKTQNNTTKFAGSFLALAFTLVLSVAAVAATDNGNKDPKAKKEDKVSKVDSLHIQEMLFELSELEDESLSFNTPSSVEVYDINDQLIFSGTKAEWENTQNPATTILKRKAELLFELEGSRVYKVF